MKHIVTNSQLLTVAEAHLESFSDECGLDVSDVTDRDFMYFMSEMNSKTRNWYAHVGGLFMDGDELHFDDSRFDTVLAMAHVVYSEYEYGDWPCPVWSALDLGGDDSVDYAGSYLDVIVGVLKFYLKHK